MRCCANCFNSQFLAEHIEVKSSDTGNCSFCPSQEVKLIAPSALADQLSPVVDLYKTTEAEGHSLIELLQNDWGLFSGDSEEKSREVLRYVFDDAGFDFENYQPIYDPEKSELLNWDDFKEELKHENRFFPKSFPDRQNLSNLLSYLSIQSDRTLEALFRARLNTDGQSPHDISEMGAPPSESASGGRANPVGISYLYVASTIKTAVSEVRPHKEDYFTVAEFKLVGGLKLIDLRNPRLTVSPFRYSEDELKNIYSGLELLVKLGDELTKPVSQNKAQLEYLSSQYLCEFIKSEGYEGVIYKSSLGDGDNYAIFNTTKLKSYGTSVYRVSNVDIHFENCHLDFTTEEEEEVPDNGQMDGLVKWFNDAKGFGFIECADKQDIFVHHTSIVSDEPRKTLIEGQSVRFSIGKNDKGFYAFNVTINE